MSELRAALYARLTGDATLTGLLGAPDGVYHRRAPSTAAAPFVILDKQSGTPTWMFQGAPLQGDLWLVKAVDRADSASAAESIAERIDAVLTDAPLQLDATLLYLRRDSDVDYGEDDGEQTYQHVGATYRVVTDRAQ